MDIAKIRKQIALVWAEFLLFPVILLVPFSTLTGFFSVEKLLLVLTSPITYVTITVAYGILLGMSELMHYSYISSYTFEKDENVRAYFSHMLMEFALAFGIMEIVAWIIVTPIADVNFPHKTTFTALVVISFELMLATPLFAKIVSMQELYLRENLPTGDKWVSISTKIWAYVGSIVIGTIMLLGLSNTIITFSPEVGRHTLVSVPVLNFVACAFAVTMLFILLRQLSKYIVKPVLNLVDSFSLGLNCDFRQRDPSGLTMDELGEASYKSDKFFSFMRDQLTNLKKVLDFLVNLKSSLNAQVNTVVVSITQINSSIGAISNDITSQSTQVEETAAAVEELTRSIDSLGSTIALTSKNVATSLGSVSSLVVENEEFHKLITETLDKTSNLVKTVEICKPMLGIIVKDIEQVSALSENLGSANKLIHDISDQTNILAMNAAIEAAHAGTVGRGFSVVADEIRTLAGKSATQSKDISGSLNDSIKFIGSLNQKAKEISVSFDVLSQDSGTTLTASKSLMSYSENIKKHAATIEESLQKLNEYAVTIKNGSSEMMSGNKEILTAVGNLRAISESVRTSITEVCSGISSIQSSGEILLDLSSKTDQAISDLRFIIEKYTID